MPNDSEGVAAIERLIGRASDVAGSTIGAIVGASTGDPGLAVAGAVAGSVFSNSVGEIATRMLSGRQEQRVATVVVEAFAALRAKEVLGETIRSDGFFDGEHSAGDEFIEGVLWAAMDSFEERKIRYMSNLLANVCFHPEIDPATANATLNLATQLSWLELQMLGLFWAAESEGRYTMPDRERESPNRTWYEVTVSQTYVDLNDKHGLIRHRPAETAPDRISTYNLNLNAVTLTNAGRLLARMMELETIPQTDLTPIYDALTAQQE